MIRITAIEEFNNVDDDNSIIGNPVCFNNCVVEFYGEKNVLVMEEGANLKNCVFSFKGNNSLIYVSKSIETISLNVLTYSDSTTFVGTNMATNGTVNIIASEARNVFIGNDCLISKQCSIRTGDAHRLYDINTGKRLNESKSVFIGDHVWLGFGVNVLKGAHLHSGCIIGLGAIVTGKEYHSCATYGGNPAKLVIDNTVYDKRGTHGMTDEMKDSIAVVQPKQLQNFIFREDSGTLSFNEIDDKLIVEKDINKRISFLKKLQEEQTHNRFSLNSSKS